MAVIYVHRTILFILNFWAEILQKFKQGKNSKIYSEQIWKSIHLYLYSYKTETTISIAVMTVIYIHRTILFILNFWPEILQKFKQGKNSKIYSE